MIVIDVGCARHGGDESIPDLVREFQPRWLFGFDPAAEAAIYRLDDSMVMVQPDAMWTYTGQVGFAVAGLGGHVDETAPKVWCRDLASVIEFYAYYSDVGEHGEIVLKMDAEGAEYVLLPHLRERDADLALKLALIEWHCSDCGLGGNGRHREGCPGDHDAWDLRRAETEALMRCELQEWNR